ncbi:glycoside hydrolase family 43 protein [Amycolatopsis marina]|nr:glycoside hydrolase family 43 protein [Amycolatopsis marina]
MRKRLCVLLVVVLAVPFSAVPSAHAAPLAPKLLLRKDFPDPEVNQFADRYYAYGTGSHETRVPVATALSPTGEWTIIGEAMPEPAAWMDEKAGVWAPDVFRRPDGKYLMYLTGRRASDGTRCLGAALSENPVGPFAPLGEEPLVCKPEEGGDIDPVSFVDDDERLYLLYKSNGPGDQPSIIWLQPVAPDGVTLTGDRRELLRSDLPEEDDVIEAPVLIRRPSHYVLFYSVKSYTNSDYHTSYATASALAGPYTKTGGRWLDRTSFDETLDGPGGADITTGSDGQQHAFFHAWLGRTQAMRAMFATGMDWKDDLPILAPPGGGTRSD